MATSEWIVRFELALDDSTLNELYEMNFVKSGSISSWINIVSVESMSYGWLRAELKANINDNYGKRIDCEIIGEVTHWTLAWFCDGWGVWGGPT